MPTISTIADPLGRPLCCGSAGERNPRRHTQIIQQTNGRTLYLDGVDRVAIVSANELSKGPIYLQREHGIETTIGVTHPDR